MEYYDPMLCSSTPSFPYIFSIVAALKEEVDGALLRKAVEAVRERYPYFHVRAKVEGNDLVPVPNPLPVTVRNTWEPTFLNSREANYHLCAWKYEGKRLAVEISHALTDGEGALPYFKSVLYLYLCQKTGQTLDPAGVRLPGSPIPETETGNPFADCDVDSAEEPLYRKAPVPDFYRLTETLFRPSDWYACWLRLPEEEVMGYCRENDGSPNVLISVLLSRAIRRLDPDSRKTVTSLVAIDQKAVLGKPENYRMFVNIAFLDFPWERRDEDVMKTCTAARGQLMLQAQPENVLYNLKTKKQGFERMRQLPLQVKTDLISKAASMPRATLGVSYVSNRSFGAMDPYIQEFYVQAEPGVNDVMCEVTCLNHSFFLTLAQTFATDRLCAALRQELEGAGIPSEITGAGPYRLSGVRYDDLERA